MKNINAIFFTGASFLLAGTVDAQNTSRSKPRGLNHGPLISNTATRSHPAHGTTLRGGGVPVNDNCGSASTVVLPLGGSITFSGDNTNATDDGDYALGDWLEDNGPVVWHKFSISECESVTVSYCGTSPAFGYFSGFLSPNCPAVWSDVILYSTFDPDLCGNGNGVIHYASLPAGEYYLPVLLDPSNSVGPYTIEVSAEVCPIPPTPPANDECAGAVTLASTADCEQTYFNTVGATESFAADCNEGSSPIANDVWFSFVCTNVEQTVGVAGYNAMDAVIELFSGSCSNMTPMGCADNTFPSSEDETTVEQLDQGGLTVGSTYYVRVYEWGNFSSEHSFAICLTEGSGNNVGIAEKKNADAMSVYPNPGIGRFTLQYAGSDGLGTIEMFDPTGRTVYSEQTYLTSGADHTLDLGNLAQGQYSLRLTINGVRSHQNVMVH